MKRNMKLMISLILFFMSLTFEVYAKIVSVRGHFRNGTYVRPHTRNVRGGSSGGYAPSGRRYSPNRKIGSPVPGSDHDAIVYSSWGRAACVTNACATTLKSSSTSDDTLRYDTCRAISDDNERCSIWIKQGGFYCDQHKDFTVTNRPHRVLGDMSGKDDAQVLTTKEKVEKMRKCIDYYSDRHDGELPSSITSLQAMNPTFMAPPIKDAWGRPFSFFENSEGLDVRSAGPDGKFGDADDIVLIMER